MRARAFVAIVGIAITSVLVAQVGDAWARARGGGSRGSRSYSAPARPSPSPASPTTPSSPSRSVGQPTAPAPTARPGLFGGLMGGLAGFALGGLLGSMLFGGLGGGLGGFGGIGLVEILLIGGALFLLFRYLRKRREAEAPAYATAGSSMAGYTDQRPNTGIGGTATVEMPAQDRGDVDRGVAYIRQMDPAFDPTVFAERVRAEFGNVQSALVLRDMTLFRDRLTPDLYAVLQGQCDELRASGRTNYVQRIDLDRSEVTEAWQESGQDFVTVYFNGTAIDYTVDDRTGQVVEGSKTEPQKVEEFWTFARPVGPNRWKVSAIQSA